MRYMDVFVVLEVHSLTILKDLICDQPNFEKNPVFDW